MLSLSSRCGERDDPAGPGGRVSLHTPYHDLQGACSPSHTHTHTNTHISDEHSRTHGDKHSVGQLRWRNVENHFWSLENGGKRRRGRERMSLDLMVGRDVGQLDSRPSLIYIVTLHTLVKTFSMCVSVRILFGDEMAGRLGMFNSLRPS